MNQHLPELDAAIVAARAAGKRVMDFFGTAVETNHKPDGTPTTAADLAAEKIIIAQLQKNFAHPMVAEETLTHTVPSDQPTWYVDPIDSTKGFLRGEEGFAVMIGLAINGLPQLGVVYLPLADQLYFAQRGMGAFVVRDNQTNRVQASTRTQPHELIIVSARLPKQNDTAKRLAAALGAADPLPTNGFGYKACLVADGTADIAVVGNWLGNRWDTCGPQIIVEEAGGKMTAGNGTSLEYHLPAYPVKNMLTATSSCYGLTLDHLDALRQADRS